MTTAQISRIAPPPSVEAVLGALTEETRIGQVDFSERLMPEPLAAELDTAAAEVAATTAETGPDDDDDASDVGAELDDPADLDDPAEDLDDTGDLDDAGDVTAKVVTLKSVPEPEPDPEPEPEPEPKPARKRATRTKPLGKALTAKRRVAKSPQATDVPDVTETATLETTEAVATEDSDDAVADLAAEPETETETDTVEYPVPASIAERVHAPAAVVPDRTDDDGHGLLEADLDEQPPTVEEIARLVVERMHDAELAMMRHLDAVEAEAARRCELLTAQAELDAELIRLNARREAHGIVTEARMRADGDGDGAADQEQLEDLTVALSRFADAVDELRPSPPRPSSGRTP